MSDRVLTIGLGEGHIELSAEEAEQFYSLTQHRGMKVLKDVLAAMDQGCTVGLRDKSKSIEDIRLLQGRYDAIGRIADILLKEVPEWYTSDAAEGSGDDHDSDDDS